MEISRPVRPFDLNVEDNRQATEWAKWKRQLECYFNACNVTDQSDKLAKLLFLGGPDLQELFDNLPDAKRVPLVLSDPPYYDVAIAALDAHFEPKRMIAYERYVFRQMSQKPSERLSDFALRLRVQAKRCGFLPDVFDDMIIDQITEKGNSDALRMEILKRDVRSLNEIIALGTAITESKVRSMQMTNKGQEVREEGMVQLVKRQRRGQVVYPPRTPAMNRGVIMSCHACGRPGHLQSSRWCPAKGVKCNKCQATGHYAKCCFRYSQPQRRDSLPNRKRPFNENAEKLDWHQRPAKRIRAVSDEIEKSSDEANIFFAMGRNEFHFRIGGVTVPMTIDSGADANIIPLSIWQQMKEAHVRVYDVSKEPDRVLRAYASSEPLKIKGMFCAEITAGSNEG
ncbi:uncharacterized protein LOC134284935 [Aedes albopictus]|uniref:CCHC-type domain-containing protein n=1 Tax=Aedes albopictus TaxID=7160 RepID=A0ABM2A4K3_AEDAL